MRAVSIFLALAMVMAGTLAFLPEKAQALEVPKLSITVEAGVGDQFVFRPVTIVLPSVPIILNVTLFNNGTIDAPHTFTIRDSTGTKRIDIRTPARGDRASLEFSVNSTNQMYFGGQLFQAEASGSGGVKFFCEPHETVGMVGNIVVGGVSALQKPEIGVFLRAYWIGLIGLAAMLVWIGITYFIIKGGSRHVRDHHDHIRRGLP